MALWETPDSARRVAEALLPVGPWLLIAKEQRGSWTLWRYARRVQPTETRTLLLDEHGKVWERTHLEGDREVVQRGPGEESMRDPISWGGTR